MEPQQPDKQGARGEAEEPKHTRGGFLEEEVSKPGGWGCSEASPTPGSRFAFETAGGQLLRERGPWAAGHFSGQVQEDSTHTHVPTERPGVQAQDSARLGQRGGGDLLGRKVQRVGQALSVRRGGAANANAILRGAGRGRLLAASLEAVASEKDADVADSLMVLQTDLEDGEGVFWEKDFQEGGAQGQSQRLSSSTERWWRRAGQEKAPGMEGSSGPEPGAEQLGRAEAGERPGRTQKSRAPGPLRSPPLLPLVWTVRAPPGCEPRRGHCLTCLCVLPLPNSLSTRTRGGEDAGAGSSLLLPPLTRLEERQPGPWVESFQASPQRRLAPSRWHIRTGTVEARTG